MPAVKKLKNYALMAGIFTVLAAVVFAGYDSLKPDLDQGVSFYQNDNCEPFRGSCLARSGIKTIKVSLGGDRIESMTELPVRVELERMSTDAVVVDFEGLDMYMGRVRTVLAPGHDGDYVGTIKLPRCGTGEMLWRARVLLEDDTGRQGVKFDFRAA